MHIVMNLSAEKRQALQRMLAQNLSAAVIADKIRIPRKIAQEIRVNYIQRNTKSLYAEQCITLTELSSAQRQRLKTLVSLNCSIYTICSALSMEKANVQKLIKECKGAN